MPCVINWQKDAIKNFLGEASRCKDIQNEKKAQYMQKYNTCIQDMRSDIQTFDY